MRKKVFILPAMEGLQSSLDSFAFCSDILGYTGGDGSVAYDVMWEEVSIDFGLLSGKKVKSYHLQLLG